MNQKAAPATESQEIDLSKVDPALVNQALKKFGLGVAGDFEERVERLQAHQRDPKNVPDEYFVQCETCNAASDARIPACPFCGEQEKPAEEASADATPAEAPSVVEADPDKPDPETIAEPEKPAKPKKPAKAKKQKLVQVVAKPDAPTTAPAPETQEMEISEAVLDQELQNIETAKAAGARCFWQLGTAIRIIHDQRLYTQRMGEDGKPKYRSWIQFVKAELHMSTEHAQRAMLCATHYTKTDFEELGISKLAMIAKLPTDMQVDLIRKAREGLPLAGVTEEVRKLNPRAKPDKPAKPEKKTKPGPDELTAIVTKERIKVALYAAPKKDGAAKVRAQTLAHLPAGVHALANGVEVHVHVQKEARGLVAVLEFRRSTNE